MIDQVLYLVNKSNGVRQLGVLVECGFIFPAGMDIEQSRILGGAEGVNRETAGFLAGSRQDFVDGGGNLVLQFWLSVEAGENEEF